MTVWVGVWGFIETGWEIENDIPHVMLGQKLTCLYAHTGTTHRLNVVESVRAVRL